MKKICCIIPAYNEGSRIEKVLNIITNHPLIDEIIVVDDGSKDDTSLVVRKFERIKLITHPKNLGKSMALYNAINESKSELILFIDADLLGLETKNITGLIEPVIQDKSDISISLRRNAPKFWRWIGLDYISGERLIPKNILVENRDSIPALPRFGFEVFLNRIIIKNNLKIKIVDWPNVDSPYKYKKSGLIKGVIGDIFMIWNIMQTVGLFGPIYQIFQLKKLEVK